MDSRKLVPNKVFHVWDRISCYYSFENAEFNLSLMEKK